MSEGTQTTREQSVGAAILLSLTSLGLGGGALWFSWFRYNGLLSQPEIQWYNWTQPFFAALMGGLCILAAILFVLRNPSGWSVFRAGLTIVPLMLFTNLLILLFRVAQSMIQGNGDSLLSRLYANPLNKGILIIVGLLILFSVLKETKNKTR